jgi:glutathione S-transferase
MVPMFWNLVRTPPEKRDHKAIDISRDKTTKAVKIVDDQLSRTSYLGGDTFSIGDMPVAIMIYRYRGLVPDRPAFPHLERWFAALSERPPFRQHVLDIGLS